jgi:hypothetical protein
MSLKGWSCWVVNIRMDDAEKLSLEAIARFVAASGEIRFEAENRQQLHGWVERVLATLTRLVIQRIDAWLSGNADGDHNASGYPEDRCMAGDLAAELLRRAR